MNIATAPTMAAPVARPAAIGKYFYLAMSFVTIAVIVYGFHFTVDKNLFHPAVPRPWLLYVHAAVFSGWLGFFLMQSTLVRTRNVQWHKRMGWVGLGLGIGVLMVGVSTSLVMARFNRDVLHSKDAESFLLVPLFDMVCFAATFTLAILWRKRPEHHRRLLLIATAALCAAGFGRFPFLPPGTFYLGVDFLIVLGIVRDLVMDRRVHTVYRYALPLMMVGQAVVIFTIIRQLPFWLRISHAMVG